MRDAIFFAASARAAWSVMRERGRPLWPNWTKAILGALVLWALLSSVGAHDSWISRGGLKNAGGEWCCGEGDCFVVPGPQVSARPDGYHIVFRQTTAVYAPKTGGTIETTQTRAEIVAYAEAQPSPDGAYWRCKRPDGSRRCFFAPPPNS
jgi:hypothetical protein